MATHTSATLISVEPAIRLGYAELTTIFSSFKKANLEDGGRGVIQGVVKEKNPISDIPLKRRVRLYKKQDGRLMRETWSNDDGTYSFDLLSIQEYYVAAFDHTDNYTAVVQDSIIPEVLL